MQPRTRGRMEPSRESPPEGVRRRALGVMCRRRARRPKGRAGAPSGSGAAVARVSARGARRRAVQVGRRRRIRFRLRGLAGAPSGSVAAVARVSAFGFILARRWGKAPPTRASRLRGRVDAPSGMGSIVAGVYACQAAPERHPCRAPPMRVSCEELRRARVHLRGCAGAHFGSTADVARLSARRVVLAPSRSRAVIARLSS